MTVFSYHTAFGLYRCMPVCMVPMEMTYENPSGKDLCVCVGYLGHLWPQVDLSQVDSLRNQVIKQLAEQHSISQSLSQVTHLVT